MSQQEFSKAPTSQTCDLKSHKNFSKKRTNKELSQTLQSTKAVCAMLTPCLFPSLLTGYSFSVFSETVLLTLWEKKTSYWHWSENPSDTFTWCCYVFQYLLLQLFPCLRLQPGWEFLQWIRLHQLESFSERVLLFLVTGKHALHLHV